MKSFEWRLRRRSCSAGKLNEIGKVAQGFGKRSLIVTTMPAPRDSPMAERIVALLETSVLDAGVSEHSVAS